MAEKTLEPTASTELGQPTASTELARAFGGAYRQTILGSLIGGVGHCPSYTLDEAAGSHVHPLLSAHDTGPAPLLGGWLRHRATSSSDCPAWFRYVGRSDPQTFVVVVHESAPSISDIARGLRDRLPLPILDVARLCGVKRRQFYNVLNGESRRTAAEQHMRVLWRAITELDDAVSHDGEQLRAALLMPITDDYMSLFDVAIAPSRRHELSEIARRLVDRLRSGDVSGLLPRPSPGLRELQTAESLQAADEVLRHTSTPLDGDGD